MKRTAFVIALIFEALWVSAQKAPGFTISHLTGDFYIYTTWQPIDGKPFPANGMYVVTAQGIVIIDSPWDTAQAVPFLDSIERRHHTRAIAAFATHFHSDRTGAYAIFQKRGIRTWSGCQTKTLCIERKEAVPQYCFTADTTFDFGDHMLQTFYPGEGHTKDNIVIWFDKEKILYGGCLVKSAEATGIGNVADANLNEWRNTISKLKKRFSSPTFIIPGHQDYEFSSFGSYTPFDY
ncbi:MAG: blaB1 [Bacteroidetes bacterium]|nr:blaB1 [Bacteroidota bacterium]